jgi:hypothetical protein
VLRVVAPWPARKEQSSYFWARAVYNLYAYAGMIIESMIVLLIVEFAGDLALFETMGAEGVKSAAQLGQRGLTAAGDTHVAAEALLERVRLVNAREDPPPYPLAVLLPLLPVLRSAAAEIPSLTVNQQDGEVQGIEIGKE